MKIDKKANQAANRNHHSKGVGDHKMDGWMRGWKDVSKGQSKLANKMDEEMDGQRNGWMQRGREEYLPPSFLRGGRD